MKDLTQQLIFSEMDVDTGTQDSAASVVLRPRAPSLQVQDLLTESHMHLWHNIFLEKREGKRLNVFISIFSKQTTFAMNIVKFNMPQCSAEYL